MFECQRLSKYIVQYYAKADEGNKVGHRGTRRQELQIPDPIDQNQRQQYCQHVQSDINT